MMLSTTCARRFPSPSMTMISEFKQSAHEGIQPFYLRRDHTKGLIQLFRGIRRAAGHLDFELDSRQRIADFVRHTRDDTTKSREPLALGELLFQFSLTREVGA